MASLLEQFGNWNTKATAGLLGGGIGKALGGLGITSGNIGGIANTIGQLGTGLLAGTNHTAAGDIMQTVGGLASSIPGVGGLIGTGVGVVGGLINAAFGSDINEEFVQQTKSQANALNSKVFNSSTNGDLLNDWKNTTLMSKVRKSEVGSDGWFSSEASDTANDLNKKIEAANARQIMNFNLAAENVDKQNDFRILQNMAAYGGPIGSYRRFYNDGGYLNQAKALIRQHEGFSEKPYNDAPRGKQWRSVGYGFNDSGFRDKYPEGISKHYERGITKEQAEKELDYFLGKAEKDLKNIYGRQWNDFSDNQKAAIIDTYYQRPASVGKKSRFYKAVTSGEDAGKYLGVAGFGKRNRSRQSIFDGISELSSLTAGASGNVSEFTQQANPTPVLEAKDVIAPLDLTGIEQTKVINPNIKLDSPKAGLLLQGLLANASPSQQQPTTPTVGTVEDFLARYDELNTNDMNMFDFGGGLTHGSDFNTGINWINEGGSHGENPNGGVPVGVDADGIPNLVEEDEAIWNGDYVFSKRMKVPKALRDKYKLPEGATFADAVARLTKDADERPLDDIARNTQEHILGELADSQEQLRMDKAQKKMEKEQQLQEDFLTGIQFGLGGDLFCRGGKLFAIGGQLSPMGIVPIADNMSPFDVLRAANEFAYGGPKGNIFRGTGDKSNSLVDTRSDTTYQGYNENAVPYNAGAVVGTFPLLDFYNAIEEASKTSDNPYLQTGIVNAPTRMPVRVDPKAFARNKQALQQSRHIARGQYQVPKGGGKPKTVTETTTPKQTATEQLVNKEGLPNGWSVSNSQPRPPFMTGRGKAEDAFAGLEGTLGTPASMVAPLVGNKFGGYAPWLVGAGAVGAGWALSPDSSDDSSKPVQATSIKGKGTGKYNVGTGTSKSNRFANQPAAITTDNGVVVTPTIGTGSTKATRSSSRVAASDDEAVQVQPQKPIDTNWVAQSPWLFNEMPETQKATSVSPMQQIAANKSSGTRAVSVSDNGTNFNVTDTTPVTRSSSSGSNSGSGESSFKPKQTWTRNLPWILNGIMGIKEMLTPADYTNANLIMDAAYQVGQPLSVGTEYLGDYRKRNPFNEQYLTSIINQNAAAANENFMNLSGGNRAAAMSGILANNLATQSSLAEAARQAFIANRMDDAQVAEFNRATNQFNAQAQNTRNLSLAQLNSNRQNAMLSGIAQGARMRQAIKDQHDAAISANLTNLVQSLGDMGKENGFYNMLGGLNKEGVLKYFFGNDWSTMFNNNSED